MSGALCVMLGSGAVEVTASPSSVSGNGTSPEVFSEPCYIFVTPPGLYTYQWSLLSGSGMSISSPTASSVFWTASGMQPGEDRSTSWECVVSLGGSPVGRATASVFLWRSDL